MTAMSHMNEYLINLGTRYLWLPYLTYEYLTY